MKSIDEIDSILSEPVSKTVKEPPINDSPMAELAREVMSLRHSIESILIFLKITDRMSEAQYRFVFSHVETTNPNEGEELDHFLTRSAIELEKKMKNMGLLKR